ncbi:DUF1058 [Desulfonema limicola]|uniref:DUF1058 n=1 Tax=Desulfonema limicola TaxID=45656 RepID=A0A975GJM9_9BACT|nr:SH3 domain-containing protein [Desulfonema limicola]QTA83655.1 DUF1058 [Desulfonema limicola]
MIKKWSLPLFILVIIYSSTAFAERMSINVPMANVRSGPGTKYKVLWKLEKYHPLQIMKKSGSWYYFRDYEGDNGWIFKGILGKEASVIAIKNKCNVRSGPGTNFDIVFTVEKGVPLKIIERKNEWIHVSHSDGDKGWIHQMLVW